MAAGRGELIIPGVTDLAEMQAVWAQTPGIRPLDLRMLDVLGCQSYFPIESLSPETRAALEEAERAYEHEREEARGAEQRARALLDARLGPQAARLFASTYKLMRPSRLWPGVEYVIFGGGDEMVRVVERGRELTRLCVVAGQGEPWPDRTMTILDLIESGQERRLWEMANVFPLLDTEIAEPPRVAPTLTRTQKAQLIFMAALPLGLMLAFILWGIFG